jgi:hypothetical protein
MFIDMITFRLGHLRNFVLVLRRTKQCRAFEDQKAVYYEMCPDV